MLTMIKSDIRNKNIGAEHFLEEMSRLNQPAREIGLQLLLKMCGDIQINLKFREKFKKFIQMPKPFWMIQIKPQLNAFDIIVFGTPKEHEIKSVIDLNPYMDHFSIFVLERRHQISETVKTVRDAQNIYQLKKHNYFRARDVRSTYEALHGRLD